MSHELTFFSKIKQTKNLKIGDKHRRELLIIMLESNVSLSKQQLSNRTDASFGFVYDMIDASVKAGYVRPLIVAQHKARKDSKYDLTDTGTLIALAISTDERRIIGDKTNVLQKIFQPQRGDDPLTFFVRYVLLNSATNGLQRYVLEFVRNLIESSETSDEPNLWKIAQNGVNEAKSSELQLLQKSVLQALEGLDESQKDAVIQYYKTKTTNMMFDTSMKSHNSSMQELARKSSKDPEGVFTKFQCRNQNCGFVQDEFYLKMEDVIVRVFSGGLQCPKCNRFTSEPKIPNKKGFRDKIPNPS